MREVECMRRQMNKQKKLKNSENENHLTPGSEQILISLNKKQQENKENQTTQKILNFYFEQRK